MNKGEVRMSVNSEDTDIYNLRLSAYNKATEFKLIDQYSLKWSENDSKGIVLTVYDIDDNPIATTSATILFNYKDAEEKMECALSTKVHKDMFPALLLGKGATSDSKQNKGLHSVLRYYLIKSAKNCSIKSVIGVVYEGAPRTSLMKNIGYDFFYPLNYWYTDLHPYKATLIAVLSESKYHFALNELQNTFSEDIASFPTNQDKLNKRLTEISIRPAKALSANETKLIDTSYGTLVLKNAQKLKALENIKISEISNSNEVSASTANKYYNESQQNVLFNLKNKSVLNILPALDGKHEIVNTKFCPESKFTYLDKNLSGPVYHNFNGNDIGCKNDEDWLLRYLSRVVDYSRANHYEEFIGFRQRYVEPGVGRSFLVESLKLNEDSYKDFSATGIGLTPYSLNGFVSVGRKPDGKVALLRAEHRKAVSENLNLIGCRASKVIAIIELLDEGVQMMDNSISTRAIIVRAFKNILRVKQIDPIAGFYHSIQHSGVISSMLIEDLKNKTYDKDVNPDFYWVRKISQIASELEHYSAAEDDLNKIVNNVNSHKNCTGKNYRRDIIKKYSSYIFEFAAERVSEEINENLNIREYLEWFAQTMGRQLKLMRENRFLHDYHHPGISRYTKNWIYTLIEHNITLSAEFADLETSVFVDNPVKQIKNNLQITDNDVSQLRKKFNEYHKTDFFKTRRVVETLARVAKCGDIIDEKKVDEIIKIFEENYKK